MHENKALKKKKKQKDFKEGQKRNKRGISNPPVVPISHTTHPTIEVQVHKGVTQNQNRPSMGSEGEMCTIEKYKRF
eukprot:842859-Ditylum_brightwellii.AAC.1